MNSLCMIPPFVSRCLEMLQTVFSWGELSDMLFFSRVMLTCHRKGGEVTQLYQFSEVKRKLHCKLDETLYLVVRLFERRFEMKLPFLLACR